jgi:DNA-directed RNA polymerase alpha subunit
MSEHMLRPMPELPDDMPLAEVGLPSRIRKALTAGGLETVGEVRETSDKVLLSFQELGKGSVAHLRETLGLPSCDGVRPVKGKNDLAHGAP